MPQTPNRRRSRRTIVKSRRRKRRTRVRTRKSDDQLDFEEGAFSPFNRRRQVMYIGSKKKRKKSKRKKKTKGKKKKGGAQGRWLSDSPEGDSAFAGPPGDSVTDDALSDTSSTDLSLFSESDGAPDFWARPAPPASRIIN